MLRDRIVPILLRAKTQGRDFTGLEIQESCADMARRSVCYNHLEEEIHIVTGDVREASAILARLLLMWSPAIPLI